MHSKSNTPICLHGRITMPLFSTSTMNSGKAANGLTMPKIFSDGGLLPYLPASQVKGALRRAAVQAILDCQNSVLNTAEDYYFNMVGGVKGGKPKPGKEAKDAGKAKTESLPSGDDGQEVVRGSALLKLRKYLPNNPVQQLFGSGELLGNFYPGHLYVTNAIPENTAVVEHAMDGTRTDDARVRPDLMMETSSEHILDEVEKMFGANKIRTEIKQKIKTKNKEKRDAKKAGEKEKESKLVDEIKALEDALDNENAVSMPWSFSYAAFTKPLPLRLTLSRDASMVELGLLLTAMDWQARNDPFYGGHKTLGFGEFSAEYNCGPDNRIILTPFEKAEVSGPLFEEALSDFEAAVAGFSLACPNKK